MRINHSFLSFLSMLNQTTDSRFIFFSTSKNTQKHEFSVRINHSFLSFLSMLNQTTDSRFIFIRHRKTLKTRIFYENKSFVSCVSFDVNFVLLSGVQNSGFLIAMLLPSNSYAFSVQKLCFYNPKAMLLKNR